MKRKTKKTTKPRHFVDMSLQAWDLAKAGAAVTFRVRDRNGLLGTVEIGQGTFGWKGAHKQSFKRTPWSTFAAWLDDA